MTNRIISATARIAVNIGSGVVVAFGVLQGFLYALLAFGVLSAAVSVIRTVIAG